MTSADTGAGAGRWGAPGEAHRLIAKALAKLVTQDPAVPPHPYLSRHLADHAARGDVLDDAHVPLAVLPWESSRKVRTLLRRTGDAGQRQEWLEAWAGIEPFLGDAGPASRLTSLHLAHHAATRRRTPLSAVPAAARRLAGSRLTPLWSDWSAPDNVLAVTDTVVESLAHTTTSDGRHLLVTGDSHGTLRRWETYGAPVGAPSHTHGGALQHLLPLPDDLLLSGGTDGTVRVWNSARGQLLSVAVHRPRTWVSGLTLLTPADGPPRVLVAHSDGHLTALDPVTFQAVDDGAARLPSLDPAPAIVTGVGLARAQGTALAVAQGRSVRVWRPGQDIVELGEHADEVRAVVDLPAPNQFVTCDDSGHIGFWDATAEGGTVTAAPSPARSLTALVAVPVDGEPAVVSAGADHVLRVWSTGSFRTVGGPLEGHTAAPLALTAVPGDAPLVVSAGADRTLRRWRLAGHGSRPAPQVRRSVTAAALPCRAVTAGPLLVAVADEEEAALWNADTGARVSLPVGDTTVTAFAWTTALGGPLLVTAHSDAGVQMWSVGPRAGLDLADAPARRGTLLSHSLPVQTMVAFPDGGRTLLATGGADGTLSLWDLGRQSRLACWDDHMLSVRGLAVLDTGRGPLVVSAGADGTLRRWDPATGPVGAPVHCGQQGVHAVAVVPAAPGERALVASGGEDGTVRLWDARTLRPDGDALDAADGPVTALTCFPGPAGRPHLAATGPGGTVHVWDVTARCRVTRIVTGSPLGVLQARPADGTDPDGHPVLLVAGKAGLSVFELNLGDY
ncbi:WD40 repeat domain-containing protein [Streptomyces sp. NRRL S-340]|uniref:WD40 repeat domain-containing protein n=1 Tax=Streptomyces sp. NRRL S-340 TaxID=1463901 RepID=UPI00056927D9|nr:benzoate transporter [Streptomyces sp. NRRL S-340]